MADQIRRFRDESTRLLQDIRNLKDSINPQTHSFNSAESVSSLPLENEDIVIEEISKIISSKLLHTLTVSTKTATDRFSQALKEIENLSKLKVSDLLDQHRPFVDPSTGQPNLIRLDNEVERKVNQIGHLMQEHLRENSARIDEILAAEKHKLENEYTKKFDTYRKNIDIYVKEISDKFKAKEQEMQTLYSNLANKIDAITTQPFIATSSGLLSPLRGRATPGERSFRESPKKPWSESVLPLDDIYAQEVPTLQTKLRKLWSATEPSKTEVLGFLDRLERGIFLGERIDRIYESEIRKSKDKLPVIQVAAKLAFFRARDDGSNLVDLEIEFAELRKNFEERWGEKIKENPEE